MKRKIFYDTEQIQLFSKMQHSRGEVCRKKCNPLTGEIIPLERGDRVYNPFTEKVERMTEYRPQDIEDYARKSCSRTINKIYDIARSDRWEWFFTLTFNPDKIDRYDYSICSLKLHYWLSNMKKKCPDMKYLVVPEQHKDGAWHFHGLFKDIDGLDMKFSGKRDKKGRRIYNCLSYTWGFTTATRITDFRRASSYLCKYITKDLCKNTKGKKRYWCSRNVERPIIEEYIIDGADYEANFLALMESCKDDAYVKQIKNMYTNVTYIDQVVFDSMSIYSKNMCLWNRCITNKK